MKLIVTFVVQSVVRTEGNIVAVYPPGPPPPGVGLVSTGRYVTPPGSPSTGDFIFTRTNTSFEEGVGLLGLGNLQVKLVTSDGTKIRFFLDYQVITADPTDPFSVTSVDGLVTAGRVNGCPRRISSRFVPIGGGAQYEVTIKVFKC